MGSGAELGQTATPDIVTEHQNTEIAGEGMTSILEDLSTEPNFSWENFRELSPLENQISKPLFDREFLVHEAKLTDLVELNFSPYAEYVNRPEIKDMMHMWMYSRFDMEVTIKCVTPAKSYGMMIGAWQPFVVDSENYYPDLTPEDWMTDENAFYLSYGESESITIPINWTGPMHYIRHMHQAETYLTFKNVDVNRFARLGRLTIKNLGFKALGTTTPMGYFQIFIRAKNPVLQGPRIPDLFEDPESGRPQSSMNQMVPMNPVARNALALGTAGGVASAVTQIAYARTSDFFNQVLSYTGKKVVEGTVNEFSNKVMSTTGMKKSESNKSTRSSMKLNPLGEISMMGYDNREESCVLADKPLVNKIPERLIGRSDEDFDIYSLCRRYGYLGAIPLSLGVSTPIFGTPFPATLTSVIKNRGYLPFLARCFRCWSGDLEMKLVIPANALIMGRIQVSLFWGNNEWTGNLTSQSDTDKIRRTGPILTKTYDIRGTSEIEFLIPYLFEYPLSWVWNQDGVATPIIVIDTLIEPNDGTIVAPLQAHVFFRAGKNFRFYHPVEPLPKYQLIPPSEAGTPQGRIQSPRSEGDFQEISSPDYSPYDHIAFHGTILDLCSRWSAHPGTDESFPVYANPDFGPNAALKNTYRNFGMFGYLSTIYAFYSGEIERKSQLAVQGSLSTGNTSMAFIAMDMYPGQSVDDKGDRLLYPKAGDGMQLIDTTIWRTLEYGIPFMSRYQMAPLQNLYWRTSFQSPLSPYLTNPVEGTTPAVVKDSAFWRPGKSFAFHMLYPPLGDQHFINPELVFDRNTEVTPPTPP